MAAGLLSRVYAGVANLVTVPILLHWLGPEAFGLIGLSATMQTLFFIMDAGLGGAITREMARGHADPGESQAVITRCRGIEKFYWAAAPVIALTAFIIGTVFTLNWSEHSAISKANMAVAILAMSAIIGLQWLHGFYTAALYGAYRHLSVAVIQALIWTARTFGAVTVLLLSEKTVANYFFWQLLVAVAGAVLLRTDLTRRVHQWRKDSRPARMVAALKDVKTVVLLASGASAALLAFNQVDKIVVGMSFDLQTFGYYMLTWQIAGALYLIYNPIYNMYLPLTVSAFAAGNRELLLSRARDGAILIALLVVPLSVTVSTFSTEIILLWTGDLVTATRAGPFLALTFAGAACHALFFGPYFVQMAAGKTGITLRVVLGLLCLMVPSMWVTAVMGFSAIVPVTLWLLASVCFLLVTALLTASELLGVRPLPWLRATVLVPLGVAAVAGVALAWWPSLGGSVSASVLRIASAWLFVTIGLLMVSADSRRVAVNVIQAVSRWESPPGR